MITKVIQEVKNVWRDLKRRKQYRQEVFKLKLKKDGYLELSRRVSDMECSFVLSTGRSGTMYLTKCLQSAINGIDVYHKPSPEFFNLSNHSYHLRDKVDILKEVAIFSRLDSMKQSYILDRAYIETSSKTTFLVKGILAAFSNSRFVHLVRNPFEFLKSGMVREYYSSEFANQSRIFPDVDGWELYSQEEKILWSWVFTNEFIEECKKIDPNRFVTITSGDLFKNKNRSLEKVMQFLTFDRALNVKRLNDIGVQNQNKPKSVNSYNEIRNSELRERVNALMRLYKF